MDTRVTPSASPPIRGMETRRRELSPSIDRESQDQCISSDRQASDVYSSKTADRAPELYRDFAHSISGSDSRSLSSVLDPDKSFQRSPQYHSNQQQDNQPLLSYREPERVSSTDMDPTFFDGQRSVPSAKRRVTKDKQSKGEREEVWPADVENAFMKALEVLPKLGRRKVLVNGKSCGRNELIADFIFQQTQKVRDRKQVSSHIQVLKNTRKHDIAFMRLLMDSGDGDDDGAPEIFNPGRTSASHSPIPSFYLEQDRESQTNFEERLTPPCETTMASVVPTPVINSPSIHYNPKLSHSSHRREFSYNKNHHRVRSSTISEMTSHYMVPYERARSRAASMQSVYQQAVTTHDSAVSFTSETSGREPFPYEKHISNSQPESMSTCDLSSIHRELFRISQSSRSIFSSFSLWPTTFGLYLNCSNMNKVRSEEWVKDNDFGSSETHIHELARAHELGPGQFRDVDVHQLSPEKFPGLYDLYENASCAFLYMKIGVNLNLHLDGNFDNTCIFDSNEQRPVRCLTLTYSFGAKVLESEEIKQASFVDGKITHSFEFVNQFFDAFFSGIKSLGTMEEVEVALCNLSLVQIYEDLEPRVEGGSPLLIMAFDFERGHGVVTPHVISSRNA
ncbi:hypothetical protein BGZ49_001791 [Haplosporangium sp. Z 27]|nr:hypothetical protein BGZ49_001791 [Haplosporangium sp. Z 27]